MFPAYLEVQILTYRENVFANIKYFVDSYEFLGSTNFMIGRGNNGCRIASGFC